MLYVDDIALHGGSFFFFRQQNTPQLAESSAVEHTAYALQVHTPPATDICTMVQGFPESRRRYVFVLRGLNRNVHMTQSLWSRCLFRREHCVLQYSLQYRRDLSYEQVRTQVLV